MPISAPVIVAYHHVPRCSPSPLRSLGPNPIRIPPRTGKSPKPRLQFLHDFVGAPERVTPIQLAAVIRLGRSGGLRNQLHGCGGSCLGGYFAFGPSVPEMMLDGLRDWGCGVVELRVGWVNGFDRLDGSNLDG
jgi:hypothetical protein